ncbi:TPA: dTDP-4-dehydrorhamnose 3,5-epimerase [Enterobacter ludwigii]|uniref:dTDP-4-dehydrorhamnose 3,5-epimerase n=1 Tax=Enterobacter TaxID=547 RepID=UPI0015F3968A|nr:MULTISPECIES: dTDP-4-dehydrorhamnose 3,5-epimerase [Enterobacter]MBA7773592.1 dTDP-4-dehydrorhamnose 3,5-epimerase [Enterobacter sp. RHBSTW-00974]MBA7778755.1 dTDP-4-dehydrorhamnose 3,5-epimerase [Enterobacter sp. RHBSTW-00318]MBA7831358.1 dTDP-4-dehydrorhamnose 3,5-epimerase [Enterobacter sp. RHBSTW-00340]MBA8039070.1 dTDP-4-dehydrorhamnose 3,5-epimerase [Enterobacter sp. RHBSTW-00131]MBG0587018.1 dTDP-4-dehydrorhamnose 3,5-epimerase [Enterobacter ludwigii]
MNVIKTKLEGVLVIEPRVFGDERGFFYETFHVKRYKEVGIKEEFVQDNRSRSAGGVLRGLHFQKTKPQGKLVTVTQGEVFDVALDLRPDSATFGQYEAIMLTGDNKIQFYIPPGFAHGFCVLSDSADFQYKCTDFYDPSDEGGLIWNDTSVNIDWPIKNPILSEKDKILPSLVQITKNIKEGW